MRSEYEVMLDKLLPWNTNAVPLPISRMRALFVAISVSILPVSSVVGAVTVVPPPKPKVVATPEPKKKILGIFGRGEAKPTPAPVIKTPATPEPTPKPRPKARKPKPAPERESADASETKPAPKTTEKAEKAEKAETQPPAPAKAEEKPKSDEPKTNPPAPEATEKPASTEKPQASTKKGGKKGAAPAPAATKIDTSNMDEAAKFRVAKAAAQEDAASVAYNKALFRKVRDIEPSLDSYVDKLEEAMMKRLNSEKKRE